MIQSYFTEIKVFLERYAAAHFVLDTSINFETRPGNQGFLHRFVLFADHSRLYFREYLDSTATGIDKLMYSYHYQDADGELIFRYDNAKHKPSLPFQNHKHVSLTQIISTELPTVADVLVEIATRHRWI